MFFGIEKWLSIDDYERLAGMLTRDALLSKLRVEHVEDIKRRMESDGEVSVARR